MYCAMDPMEFKDFIVKSVNISEEFDNFVELESKDGQKLNIEVCSDCCDNSYFDKDSVEDLKGLVGQVLVSLEDVETNAEVTDPPEGSKPENDAQAVHCLVFRTTSSEISVLWRNDSNGCYDGRVFATLFPSEVTK